MTADAVTPSQRPAPPPRPSTLARGRKQLLSIQYLRAIAVTMVVFHHAINPADWLYNPMEGFALGAAGVDLFFVISGFIMFTAARSESAITFAWRRFARVAPMYWLATLALLMLGVVRGVAQFDAATLEHVGRSLLFLPHYNPAHPGRVWPYLVPGWSLNYEMFFYLIFAIGLLCRKLVLFVSGLILIMVAIGIAVDARSPAIRTYTSLYLLQFLAGFWIAILFEKGLIRRFVVAMPAGIVLMAIFGGDPDHIVEKGLAAALIVIGGISLEPYIKTLPVVRLIGDASYSIYLSHIITLTFLYAAISRMNLDGPAEFVFFVTAALIACALAGIAVHRWCEKPLLKLMVGRSRPPTASASN